VAPPFARSLALPPPSSHRDSAKLSERALGRRTERPGGSGSREAGARGALRAARRRRPGSWQVSGAAGRPVGAGAGGAGAAGGGGSARGAVSSSCSDAGSRLPGRMDPARRSPGLPRVGERA
jgi:hypothetical protein